MNNIEIPTLLFWENGNSWYGRWGNARFFIKPERSEDGSETQLNIQFWRGPLTMELSEILSTASFPMSEKGLCQIVSWLDEQTTELINGSAEHKVASFS